MSSPGQHVGQNCLFFGIDVAKTPCSFRATEHWHHLRQRNHCRAQQSHMCSGSISSIATTSLPSTLLRNVWVLVFPAAHRFLQQARLQAQHPKDHNRCCDHSFPKGCGFLSTHIWPRQVHLASQTNIDSSRQDAQPCMNFWDMLSFQASIKFLNKVEHTRNMCAFRSSQWFNEERTHVLRRFAATMGR